MQELSRKIERSDLASQALDANQRAQTDESLLAQADRDLAAARAALDAAEGKGDYKAVDALRRDVLFRADSRGLREGPARSSRAHADELLAQGGFASVEEARSAVLEDDERKDIARRLSAYQEDYASTLARCQESEKDEASDAQPGEE